jgi:hypothetical protein
MRILTDKASIFALSSYYVILTLFDLRQNSLSVGFDLRHGTRLRHLIGALAQKREATKAVPFWLDKASIGG